MNENNTEFTAGLALQNSEDNKREITYIYSKLKNINSNLESINTQISDLETNVGSATNNHEDQAGNKLCYSYCVGGLTGAYSMQNASSIIKDVYIACKQSTFCKFRVTLVANKNFTAEMKDWFKAYINDEEVYADNFETTFVDKKIYEINISFYATLNVGTNIFYLKVFSNYTSNYLSLRYLKLEVNASNKIFISLHQDFNISTNGAIYLLKNGIIGKPYHEFSDIDSLVNFDYIANHNTSYIGRAVYPTDIQYAFLPTLNENNNIFEKGNYVYSSQVANTIWIYYSASNYKSFGNCIKNNTPFGFGEYTNGTVGGVSSIYQGTYSNAPNLICCYRYGTSSGGYGYSSGSLPENFGTIFYYDIVKTTTNQPMQNLTCIAYNTDGLAFFIKTEFNGNKPYVNTQNMVQIFEDVKKSHTYFHNNLYYCFYFKDNCVYRKVFSYENGAITTISDQFFSMSQEVVVANNNYICEIKNGLPYYVEKCFYE